MVMGPELCEWWVLCGSAGDHPGRGDCHRQNRWSQRRHWLPRTEHRTDRERPSLCSWERFHSSEEWQAAIATQFPLLYKRTTSAEIQAVVNKPSFAFPLIRHPDWFHRRPVPSELSSSCELCHVSGLVAREEVHHFWKR